MQNEDRWDSQNYKENSDPQFEGAMSALVSYNFKKNESVLDIGCGDGKVTAEIAKLVPDGTVLGIDVSPNMIEFSKKNFSDIPNLSFQVADAAAFRTD
jgi:trans-aconitate 2-methyltransferase